MISVRKASAVGGVCCCCWAWELWQSTAKCVISFLFCSNILCLTSIFSIFEPDKIAPGEYAVEYVSLDYGMRWHVCQTQLLRKKTGGKHLPVIITGKSQQALTCSAVSHRAQTLSVNPAVRLPKTISTSHPKHHSPLIDQRKWNTHFYETLQSDVDPVSCLFPVKGPQHEHKSGTQKARCGPRSLLPSRLFVFMGVLVTETIVSCRAGARRWRWGWNCCLKRGGQGTIQGDASCSS